MAFAVFGKNFDLVIALANGRPCETKVIENAFSRLMRDANLPNVVFHSLRHPNVKPKTKNFYPRYTENI